VVDFNHHHTNQAHTELVVVVLVVVLVLVPDLMLLVLLSLMSIPTVMELSIVMNSAASINKVYKLIFQIIEKITTNIKMARQL